MELPVPDFLNNLDPSLAGYASVGLIGVTALIVWRLARRIVALGYFLLYFFIGFTVVYAASAYSTKSLNVPLAMPVMGGLAFSAAASAIRAKLMRVVGAVMLVALTSLIGKYWTQFAQQDSSVTVQQQQDATRALATAKKEWSELVPLLPKGEKGKIRPGYLSSADLKKLGVTTDLVKTKQVPAWHTFLTGLHEQETEDLAIWTPGGSAEQARKGLTLKPKK